MVACSASNHILYIPAYPGYSSSLGGIEAVLFLQTQVLHFQPFSASFKWIFFFQVLRERKKTVPLCAQHAEMLSRT